MTRVPVLWLVLVGLFVSAAPAESQSRLNFPKVLSVDELRTSGFALVNTSSSPAAANFSLYGADGRLLVSSTLNVPVGGQVARLGSEILTSAGGSGWVQVTSSNSELQGFELLGDFATVTDGAGPAPEATQLVALGFSREDVLHIVNPGSRSGTVQITLYDANGGTLNTRSVPLAAFQPASLRLGDAAGDDRLDMITLRADVPVSASVI